MDKPWLFLLEHWRLRRNVIEAINLKKVYKIMSGLDKVDSQNLFPRVEMSKDTVHSFKVRGGFKEDVWGFCGGCFKHVAMGVGRSKYDNDILRGI